MLLNAERYVPIYLIMLETQSELHNDLMHHTPEPDVDSHR